LATPAGATTSASRTPDLDTVSAGTNKASVSVALSLPGFESVMPEGAVTVAVLMASCAETVPRQRSKVSSEAARHARATAPGRRPESISTVTLPPVKNSAGALKAIFGTGRQISLKQNACQFLPARLGRGPCPCITAYSLLHGCPQRQERRDRAQGSSIFFNGLQG